MQKFQTKSITDKYNQHSHKLLFMVDYMFVVCVFVSLGTAVILIHTDVIVLSHICFQQYAQGAAYNSFSSLIPNK